MFIVGFVVNKLRSILLTQKLVENLSIKKKAEKSIHEIFKEGTLIVSALKKAVQEALIRHKQASNHIVVWRDGKIVWLKPEEIPVAKA